MALAKKFPNFGVFMQLSGVILAGLLLLDACTSDDSSKKNEAKQASPAEQPATDGRADGGVPAGPVGPNDGANSAEQPGPEGTTPMAGMEDPGQMEDSVTETPVEEAPQVVYRAAVVRDFRQYSQNLSVVTGIALAEESIQDTISEIMYSLPANNDVEGYTPFNQVAMLRLAHSFCAEYWQANSTLGNMSEEQIVDAVLERFNPHSLDEASRAVVRTEMLALMSFREGSNSKQSGFLLSCSAFLASAYFTFF